MKEKLTFTLWEKCFCATNVVQIVNPENCRTLFISSLYPIPCACTSLTDRCTFLCNNPAFLTRYGLCRSSLISSLFCFLIDRSTVFYCSITKYSLPCSCRVSVFQWRYIYYCIDQTWRTYLCNKSAVLVQRSDRKVPSRISFLRLSSEFTAL